MYLLMKMLYKSCDLIKKTSLLLIISLCNTNILFSQQIISLPSEEMQKIAIVDKKLVIDTCVLEIRYEMKSVVDTNFSENKKINHMTLQIGKSVSKYSDALSLKRDSISEVYAMQKISMINALNRLLPAIKGNSPINIFKNYPTGKITVTDRIPLTGNFKYIENHVKPNWQLDSGSMSICGYKCKKAKTVFRGRKYVAWYAEKIPISDGPWKFWGLPGLILKIQDDKGNYSFDCTGIQKSLKKPIYISEREYINTTKDKFYKALKEFHENPAAVLRTSGKIEGGPDNIKSRPYNPIELE